MGKSLVIVESPAKAKTINKYLGNDFVVKSSVGHIRDLPTGSKKKPVDPKERARKAAADVDAAHSLALPQWSGAGAACPRRRAAAGR